MLTKTQVVLFIYDELIHGKKIHTNSIIGEFNISLRTFRRYISEINAYFANFYKNTIIKYNRSEKYFYL